jgi:hypothetical protein
MFALSSLLSIIEEQVESLGDEELALVASRFTRFHNNCMSRRRGGSKDGCYNCGDPDHFIASCPKKGKSEPGPRDHHSGRRKGKYSSGKYKCWHFLSVARWPTRVNSDDNRVTC